MVDFFSGLKNMETDTKLKPAYLPMKCPVCNGFGTVNWGKATCHACEGRGFVYVPAVSEKEKKEYGKS